MFTLFKREREKRPRPMITTPERRTERRTIFQRNNSHSPSGFTIR
jgi:hypothetical protein